MTVFYPDISSYEAGLRIQPGTVAVVAKATEGTYYVDSYYDDFKAQAANVGATFSGYHFLVTSSSVAAQAQAYFNKAGTTPCMLDVETTGTSKPSVDLVVAFIEALKGLGGRVWGVYFPKWYWEQVGGDLGRLTAAGAVLVSSSYTSYSDSGPGWAPYGGATPAVWQYTNAQSYGGQSMDFNAFKGTAEQLANLINGDGMEPNTLLNYAPNITGWYPDVKSNEGVTGTATVEHVMTMTEGRVAHVIHQLETLQKAVDSLTATVSRLATGAAPTAQAVAAETLAELKAKL